eukprot:GHVS01043978.1.p1 GENE.GHVS01043978.1~~GHVS01043978.1.p1  ORF type:complete len:1157 (+),score=422.26 GHVS01043978.1:77-3547(+)
MAMIALLLTSSSFPLLLLFFVFFLLHDFSAEASNLVIGVDLGEEYLKVAMVSPGRPFEIILNANSKRKTPAALSFTPTARWLGDEALPQLSKLPASTFTFTNSLLGSSSPPSDPASAGVSVGPTGFSSLFYPFEVLEDTSRGSLRMRVREGLELAPEELTANLLSLVRKMAADAAGIDDSPPPIIPFNLPTEDAKMQEVLKGAGLEKLLMQNNRAHSPIGSVLTIPCSFTQRQRQALVDAAELAGLQVLGLVHSVTAAAVHHSLDLELPPSPAGNKTEQTKTEGQQQTTMIIDVGSKSVEAGVVKFSKVKVKDMGREREAVHVHQLSCVSAPDAGGHMADMAIAEEMKRRFEAKHKHNLSDQPRVLKKLLNQSIRVKHNLSANRKTEFYIESIYKDIDFKDTLTRQELEQLLEKKGLFDRLRHPFTEAMRLSNTTLPSSTNNSTNSTYVLDTVEVVGGGWRIPRIQEEVASMAHPLDLGQHLNGDEAMAMGAALMAANSSSLFRVKKVLVTDIAAFDYTVQITHLKDAGLADDAQEEEGERYNKSRELFGHRSRLSGTKSIILKNMEEDLQVRLFEDGHLLSTFNVTGIAHAAANPPRLHRGPPKVHVMFKVDLAGIIRLDKSYASFEELPVEQDKEIVGGKEEEEAIAGAGEKEKEVVDAGVSSTGDGSSEPDKEKGKEETGEEVEKNHEGNNKTKQEGDKSTEDKKEEPEEKKKKKEDNNEATKKDDKPPAKSTKTTTAEPKPSGNISLSFVESQLAPRPMSPADKLEARKHLSDLDTADRKARELAVERNGLEEFIYKTRELLGTLGESIEQLDAAEKEEKDRWEEKLIQWERRERERLAREEKEKVEKEIREKKAAEEEARKKAEEEVKKRKEEERKKAEEKEKKEEGDDKTTDETAGTKIEEKEGEATAEDDKDEKKTEEVDKTGKASPTKTTEPSQAKTKEEVDEEKMAKAEGEKPTTSATDEGDKAAKSTTEAKKETKKKKSEKTSSSSSRSNPKGPRSPPVFRSTISSELRRQAALATVSSEEERERLLAGLGMAEEWLYDDGYDADIEALLAKKKEVEGLVGDVEKRAQEEASRRLAAMEGRKETTTTAKTAAADAVEMTEETKPPTTEENEETKIKDGNKEEATGGGEEGRNQEEVKEPADTKDEL